MSTETLKKVIESYMALDLPNYLFNWQGGEPLMMGVDFFRTVTELQNRYGQRGAVVSNTLQTNAIGIHDEFARHLAEYRFLVGVSLDGPRDIHNSNRKNSAGKGTYDEVLSGMECLSKNKVMFNTITVVSKANVKKGKEVYRSLKKLGIQHHQYVPCVEFDSKGNPLPYSITGDDWGAFLCEVFDEWIKNDIHSVSVRLFDEILSKMTYGKAGICHMGRSCDSYLVVEFNGDIYPCDFFVEPELRLGNIIEASWEKMLCSPIFHSFSRKKIQWNSECENCLFLDYCSGDCLKYRIYDKKDYNSLSWLCRGWKLFYSHSLPVLRKLSNSI
jgi:uncharacterized protein